MNTIKTVGDLRKALSAYDDNLQISPEVYAADGSFRKLSLSCDTQLCRVIASDGSVNGALKAADDPANGRLQMTFMDRG